MTPTPYSLLERLARPMAEETLTEEENAAANQQRNADWARFDHLFTPVICTLANRLCSDLSDAAALAAEVYLTLRQKIPAGKFDPERGRFRHWLKAVMVNKWREMCRRERSRNRERHELSFEPTLPDSVEAFFNAEYTQLLAARALTLIQKEFSPETGTAFVETAVNGRAASEVAEALGVNVRKVYASKGLVLGRLRQELRGLVD